MASSEASACASSEAGTCSSSEGGGCASSEADVAEPLEITSLYKSAFSAQFC